MAKPEPQQNLLAELAAWDVVSRIPSMGKHTTAKDIVRQFDGPALSEKQITLDTQGVFDFYQNMQRRSAISVSDLARAASSEGSQRRKVGDYVVEIRHHGKRSFLVLKLNDQKAPESLSLSNSTSQSAVTITLNEAFEGYIQQELLGPDGQNVILLLGQSDSVISLH